MKKILPFLFIPIMLLSTLSSCVQGDVQPVSTPRGTYDDPEITPTSRPILWPTPEINSAVDFLNSEDKVPGWMVDQAISDQKAVGQYPGNLTPGCWFRETLPNYNGRKENLRLLDVEQSRRILTAGDLTDISYKQSEQLPLILSWPDVSIINVYSFSHEDTQYAYKAFYYYLEDSTVIIVNDAGRFAKENEKAGKYKAWILVIPKENEEAYPFKIPEKGTVVSPDTENAAAFASYYDELREYLIESTDARPVPDIMTMPAETAEPTEPPVIEDYMWDYVKWMEWRQEHPSEYAEWKKQDLPQKELEKWTVDHYDHISTKFRVYDLPWCLQFLKEGDTEPVWDPWYATLPRFYRCIKEFKIPKEEFLEYVKWQNWSPYFETVAFDRDLVDILYSGNDDRVREVMKRSDVYYFEGTLYFEWEVYGAIPAQELPRLFPGEAFDELAAMLEDNSNYYLKQFYMTPGRLERIKNARTKYGQLCKDDEGELTMSSAARLLSTFMDLYRYTRYSPDALAGEAVTYPEWGSPDDVYFPYFHFMTIPKSELEEMAFTCLAPELRGEYGFMGEGVYGSQLHLALWGNADLDRNVVSVRPEHYNGPVELFSDSCKLEDHITITGGDSENAEATFTAKSRGGGEDLSFSVEFRKVSGIWYVSGGTIVDLLAQVYPTGNVSPDLLRP